MLNRLKSLAAISAAVLVVVIAVVFLNGCEPEVGLGPSVDINPPVVSLDSHELNSYISGSVTLSGAATDDQGVKSVVLDIDGTPYPADVTVSGWSLDLDTTSLDDGPKPISVTVTDNQDKTSEVVWNLNVDNTPPVVLLDTPSLGSAQLNDKIQFTGSAYDNLELTDVTLILTTDEATPVDLVNDSVDGLATWSYSFDSSTADAGNPYNGDCILTLRAEDAAGNVSSHFYHAEALLSADSDIRIAKNVFLLENGGTVPDVDLDQDDTLALSQTVLNYAINQSTDLPVVTLDGFPVSGSVTFHTSNKIRLEVTDDDLVTSVQYYIKRVDDPSVPVLKDIEPEHSSVIPSRTVTWEHSLSEYAIQQGSYIIRIVARDNNTLPKETDTGDRTFVIDAGSPNLTVADQALLSGSFQSGAFVVSGTAADGSSVDRVEIVAGGQTFTAALIETVPQNYTWSCPIDPLADGIPEGEVLLEVRAVDEGSNVTQINIPMTVDLSDPEIVLTGPSVAVDQNGLMTIRGTADDNFQIAATKYSINGGALIAFPSSYTWEHTFDTVPYSDLGSGLGTVAFLVQVTDKSGRVTEETFTYNINQTSDRPQITFSNIVASAVDPLDNALDANPVLMGSVTDDDNVSAGSIQIRVKAATADWPTDAPYGWAAVSAPPAGDNNVVTWSHSLSGSSEGSYVVEVRAYDDETADYADTFKAVATSSIPFVIDAAAPTLSGILPATGAYLNGDFILSGQATDSMGVSLVQITLNGATQTATTSNDFEDWTLSVDTSTLADGDYPVQILTQDNSGKQDTENLIYHIDKTPPQIPAGDIVPADGAILNGVTDIQGSASDPGLIVDVHYSFTGQTGSWEEISDDGLYAWRILGFDTSDYDKYILGTAADAAALASVTGMATGDYYKITAPESYVRYDGSAWQPITPDDPWPVVLRIRVTDTAGNQGIQTLNLTVNQSADRPQVTLSNLDAGGDASTNLLETNPRIIGLVADDDGINALENASSLIEISFDYDGTNEATATWTPVTYTASGTNIGWNYDLYSGASLIAGVAEGVNTFSIRARDIIFGTAGDTGYNKGIVGPVEFAIDLAAPEITLSAGSVENGDYLTGAGGTLIFTVNEANLSDLSQITVNGSSVGITPTVNPDEYSLVLDTSAAPEGNNTLTIRAEDDYGKATTVQISYIVDRSEPQISVNNLAGNPVLNGDTFTVSGSIDESYGLDTTGYPITATVYQGATVVAQGTVNGSYSWTFDVDMDSLIPGDDSGIADALDYTLTLTARDMAGNIGTTPPISFSVNQADDLPTAELSNFAAADDNLRQPTISIVHSAGKEILAGVLYSDSPINTAGVTLTVGGVNRTASMVFQGSGTVVPFYLDMSNSTAYPDNIYTVSMGLPTGVSALWDVIGNTVAVVNTGTKFITQVEDDDAVHAYTISIDDAEVISTVGNTGKIYNPTWTVDAGLTSGIHLIRLTSTDASGLEASTWAFFIKDTGAPAITISAPNQGAYVNDDVSTSGSATDDYALKSLSIIAYRADSTPIYDFGTSETWTKTNLRDWSWDFTLEALPDVYSSESVTLEYTATDFIGGQTAKQRAITVDNMSPDIDIRYPGTDETLNGAVEIQGEASDDGLDEIRVRFGYYPVPGNWSGTDWLVPDGLYNWTYNLANVVNFANRQYAVEQFTIAGTYANTGEIASPVIGAVYYLTDSHSTVLYTSGATFQTYYDLWLSGIEVRATDKAGNVSTEYQTMKVDANSDRPIVTVIQPTLADSTQGGTLMIFGTARDDDGLLRLEAQVDVNGDDDFDDSIDLYNGSAFTYDGDTDDPFEVESQWYTLDGTESWTLELNRFGELYARGDHAGDGGLTGTVNVRIRAVDIYGVESNVSTRTVSLDNTVPVIEGLNYLSGSYIHGDQTLHADVTDDVLGGVKSLAVSYNNGSNWTVLYDYPSSYVDGSVTVNSLINLDLDLPLETTNSSSPAFIGSSDVLYLVLRVVDTSNYQTLKYVYLNVDNQLPSANLKLDDPEIFNPYDINGSEARIYGHASDVGTISGLSRMVVWFSRGTTVFDIHSGTSTVVADPTDRAAVMSLNDYSVSGSEEIYAVLVDDMNEYGEDALPNGDKDLIDEYITGAIGGTDWWFLFDSHNIPDGNLTIHYFVEDQAGNTVQYSQPANIANNKPVFLTTMIGDDIDRNGAVSSVEKYPYPVTGTRPPIMEEMEVIITMDKPCLFEVFYGDLSTSIRAETSVLATTFTFNEDSIGSGNDYAAGNHTFYIRATDSNGVYTLKQILVTVHEGDTTNPTLQIFPLDESYTDNRDAAVVSNLNDESQPRPVLTDPLAPYNGTYQGHLEFSDWSVNDTLGQEDADVSGIVTLRGYVHDNRGLKALAATVSGFAAGAPKDLNGDLDTSDPYESSVLAYWDPAQGRLVSNLTDFATDHQEFTISTVSGSNVYSVEDQGLDQDGHILYWTWKWDTSQVTNVAALNVAVTFTAVDFYNRTNTFGTTPLETDTDGYDQFDVVPYVSRLTTPQSLLGGLKDQIIRSASGAYSIRSGSTTDFIMVSGYNLSPIANGVRITSEADRLGVSGTSLLGNSLSFNAPTNGYRNITLSNNTTNSGYLAFVGGTALAPVAALNNVNKDDAVSNREPDAVSRKNLLFNDDRFIRFFAITDTGLENSFFPNMVMVGNTPMFGYVQSGAAYDLQVRRGSTSASNTPLVRILSADQLSMARDEGGRYHMVSINNFNNGRMVYFNHEFATSYTGGNGRDGGGNNGYTSPYWSGFIGENSSDEDNNAIELDSVNYTPGLQLSRYKRPVLRTLGNATTTAGASLYLAYYDAFSSELLFRSWKVGNNLTGGTHDLYGTYESTLSDRTVTSGDTTRKLITSQASEYFDMVVTPTGVVVVAYYNQVTSTLTVRYSATTNNGTTAQPLTGANPGADVYWSAPILLDRQYVGWYPSMTLGSDGSIHIAAYDSSGADLCYIYMTGYNDTTPEVVTVDSYNSVGYYTDIKLLAGKPYIAYYSISDTGTRDSLRLAWYTDAYDFTPLVGGVDDDGYVTGAWETMAVPVNSVPAGSDYKFYKVNLGFTTGNVPTVGYSGAHIEYSQPLAEL